MGKENLSYRSELAAVPAFYPDAFIVLLFGLLVAIVKLVNSVPLATEHLNPLDCINMIAAI